jgi:short-subunit dehydrogenase
LRHGNVAAVLELARSRVLVTGASSGIGAELAVRLAAKGATVGLVARRTAKLHDVAQRCRDAGGEAVVWSADLGDLELAAGVAKEALERLDPLDAVVHNAAIPKRRHASRLTPADVADAMRVNFTSPVRMTLAMLPQFLTRGGGMFVFVSSLAGRVGVPIEAAYSSSKFALCGFAESLAIDLAGTGVEVRLVLPGAIDTEIWDQPGNEAPVYDGPKEPAGDVAEGIIDVMQSDKFEAYVPDLKAIVEFKTSDIDTYLAGASELGQRGAAAELT